MTFLHAPLAMATLALGLASAATASAQPSVSAQPPVAAERPLTAQPLAPPVRPPNEAAGDGVARARYMVEAISFTALNETGIDFLGSDEIVVRFAANERMSFSGIYGSVDTGDTHSLRSGQQCIYPAIDPDGTYNHNWSCNSRGGFGPVSFQITLYEFDGFLRGMLTNPLQFCIHGGTDLLAGCDEITLMSTAIGSGYVALTEAEMAALMPTIGASVERVVSIASSYQVNIRLTRLRGSLVPPVGDEPPVGPVEPSQPCVPTPGNPCP